MAPALKSTVQHLRRLAGIAQAAASSDRRLLEMFAQTGDEAAFAALVRRHGDLVLGVCRRVLGNVQDAEDAFQAVFLVLAKKAGSQVWHDSIGNWLHGVAFRIAMKARTARLRRQKHEARAAPQGATPQGAIPPAEPAWQDLRRLLDEEMQQLPARYRAPLVLCYLEGKTRDEAAEELGWSAGSVKGRLERGRDMLRQRLSRRGLTLPAVLCAGLLTETAEAGVPAGLTAATIQAASHFAAGTVAGLSCPVIQLAQGVLYAMMIAKIKIAALVIAGFSVLGLGVGLWSHGLQAQAPQQPANLQALFDQYVAFADPAALDDALGQEGDNKEKRPGIRKDGAIRGQIKSIDIDKGFLVLFTPRDGGGVEKTYNLAAKDIKVILATGAAFKLTDVKEGMRVFLDVNAADDVTAIEVELPTVIGPLASVNVDKKTIVIRSEGIKTLPVADDAKLTILGKACKLSDLTAGMRVTVTLSMDRSTVVAVAAGRGIGDGGKERPAGDKKDRPREGDGEARPVTGVLLGAGKDTIDILTGGEENPAKQSFTVGADVKVTLRLGRNTQDLLLGDLKPPVRVALHLQADKKTVKSIDVQAPMLKTVVKSVDPASNKLVVGGGEAGEKELGVPATAKIMVPRGTKLADLTPGLRIVVFLNPERTQVLAILGIQGDGER